MITSDAPGHGILSRAILDGRTHHPAVWSRVIPAYVCDTRHPGDTQSTIPNAHFLAADLP